MCEPLHTSLLVQKMQGALSFSANRSSFPIGQLLLGDLSKTVVVVGNAPHDRPCGLVGHLIGNCASFLCTKAPMFRIPETNFLHGITSHQLAGSGGLLSPSPPTEKAAAARLLLRVLGQLVVDGPHIADRTATLVLRAAKPEPCLDVAVQLKEHSPSIAVVLPVDVHTPLRYFEKGGTIHTQATR